MHDPDQILKRNGVFQVTPDRRVNGSLSIWAEQISVDLWDVDKFNIDIPLNTVIHGVLDDLTRISLIGCRIRSERTIARHDGVASTFKVLPSIVIIGDRYFTDQDREVLSISVVIEDSEILFYDAEAFGTVFGNQEMIQHVANQRGPDEKRSLEGLGWITYYTGKTRIFTSETEMGIVSANHSTTFRSESAKFPNQEREVTLDIEFKEKASVVEALSQMKKVVRFCALIVGRAQNVKKVVICSGTKETPEISQVYDDKYLYRQDVRFTNEPDNLNLLIDPVKDSDDFSMVLSSWLSRDEQWNLARTRLDEGWGETRYGFDRLIRAANVFDLIPNTEYQDDSVLDPKIVNAICLSKQLFRELPLGPERDSVLSCLGRIGTWTLRKKIHHRSRCIIEKIESIVPQIDFVIDEAVKYRNYLVHGRNGIENEFKYKSYIVFLTKTLEFVFLASDLIDMGWDADSWYNKNKTHGHPFVQYLSDFNGSLIGMRMVKSKC